MHRPDPLQPRRQLGLFHPPIHLPQWTALPIHTRQTVMALLVELLKAAALQTAPPAGEGEESDDE